MQWNIILLIFTIGTIEPPTIIRTGIMANMEQCANAELSAQKTQPAKGGYTEAVCINRDTLELKDNYPAKNKTQ
ncbi:MAG: hypothetical protein COB36_06910 [Alphaproteobacteria bacterium]|nr:MAG: hypothetical protein COB36_06910 [Alphaproteobacteria bacterium]